MEDRIRLSMKNINQKTGQPKDIPVIKESASKKNSSNENNN